MTEFACLLSLQKSFPSILVFAFGSTFRECPVEVVIKKSVFCMLVLEEQTKVDKHALHCLSSTWLRFEMKGMRYLLSARVSTCVTAEIVE